MKKILLLAATAMLSVLSVSAQWTKPAAKSLDIEDVAANRTTVRILNVEYGAFLGGANAWGTQTSLITPGLDYVIETADNGTDYKLLTSSGSKAGKYVFRDNVSGCFIDMGSQNRGFNWSIQKTNNGYYTIQSPIDDPVYGTEYYDNAADMYFGWNGDGNIVFANCTAEVEDENGEVSPAAHFAIEWAFLSLEDAAAYEEAIKPYNAAMELKAVIDKAKADYPSVDCSKAEAVFNNTASTVEELNDAKKLVSNAIAAVHSAEVLEGASESNPVDGTELIANAAFDAGNISGWVCTFVSGTTANNVGYQGASYPKDGVAPTAWQDPETGEVGESRISKFIEAWAANVNEMKRDGKSFATIGDAKLCQTIYGLPAGKYKLSCDAIAVQQWDGSQNPVTGVQLYATAGEIDSYANIASENEKPNHTILTFIHTGGDVELGLRTQGATANWIAADNFTLKYYGPITKNPYLIILEDYIAEVEKTYPEIDDIIAKGDAKSDLEAALNLAKEAEGEDEAYISAKENLEAAVAALEKSIAAYKNLKAQLDLVNERVVELDGTDWNELAGLLSDKLNEWEEAYENGTFDEEEIATLATTINDMIADYVSDNLQPGNDVTILLQNPNFTTNFSGWSTTGTAPVWGANYGNGENFNADLCTEAPEKNDGLAERWRASFSMFQTIKNMPAGLYTLSVQGYNRDELGGNPAELYAILPDGTEQVGAFHNIDDFGTEDQLYAGENAGAYPSDKLRATGYTPDSMTGAAWHFVNKSNGEDYDYINKFNIFMPEQGDLTIGARCDNAGQWVIFDNFRIIYKGTGASVYEGPIKDLIAEVEAKKAQVTDPMGEEIDEAIKAAEEALNSEDEDACKQAITDLTATVAAANENIRIKNDLVDYMYNTYSVAYYENADYLVDNYAKYAKEAEKLNAYAEDEELVNALSNDEMKQLKADAEKMIQIMEEAMNFAENPTIIPDNYADATDENPVDFDEAIVDATFDDFVDGKYPAWLGNSFGQGGTVANCGERWQSTFDSYQMLYNLPEGTYGLKVQGFYREGGPAEEYAIKAGEAEHAHDVYLYATVGEKTFKVALPKISEGAVSTSEAPTLDGTYTNADETVVPNTMLSADAWFQNGYYNAEVLFEVGKEGIARVGVNNDANLGNDWTIVDNFMLTYYGANSKKETAIQNIDLNAQKVIFDLTGRKVAKTQKGLYIINNKKVVVK